MPGKLLILTYHGAGALTGEDLRFKEAAITSTLVSGDAMDEVGQNNSGPKPFLDAHADLLLQPPGSRDPAGVDLAKLNATTLVTFNRLGMHAWNRPGYIRRPNPADAMSHLPSVFEQWLMKVFATPVEVLVLAGHHSNSVIWGAEQTQGTRHRPYAALVPSGADATIEMRGFPSSASKYADLRAGPFDMTNALKRCRLLVVLGCNGATPNIKGWRDCIKKARGSAPIIFGVRGVHTFPRDADGEFLSPELWNSLSALAPGSPGSKNLDFLDDPNAFADIRSAWFTAVGTAFKSGSKRRHLFFSERDSQGGRGPRGAAIVDRGGTIYRIKDKAGNFERVTEPIP